MSLKNSVSKIVALNLCFIIAFCLYTNQLQRLYYHKNDVYNNRQSNCSSINFADDTGNFQKLHPPESDFHVFVTTVAYFDDRVDVGLPYPCLRIYILLSDNTPESFISSFSVHTCANDRPFGVNSLSYIFGQGMKMNNKKYKQQLLTVKLNKNNSENISGWITLKSKEFKYRDNALKIIFAIQKNPIDFVVLTKPLFGQMTEKDMPAFIEWMELNLHFGATEVHIYNTSLQLSTKAWDMFQYYQKQGYLVIHQFHSVVSHSSSKEFQACELLGRAAIFDFMYKNYKSINYIVLIDLDELIVPVQYNNYSTMFEFLEAKLPNYKTYAHLSDEMYGFFLTDKQDTNQPYYLKTLRYRQKSTYRDEFFTRKKSFIKPMFCTMAFPHGCSMAVRGHQVAQLPPGLVQYNHYRKVNKFPDQPLANVNLDDTMFKYEQFMTQVVTQKLNMFGYDWQNYEKTN